MSRKSWAIVPALPMLLALLGCDEQRTFEREVAALGLPAAPSNTAPVTEADIASLPAPAQRYLRFMGAVGRPRDWSIRARLHGRFRPSVDAAWQELDALQYSSGAPRITRLFYMRLRFWGLMVQGRDTYVNGRGRLLVRLLDWFTVQDGTGEPFDIGELVTWLNDGIMLAPGMLLTPEVTWGAVNDTAFDVRVTDAGRTVTARVFVDSRGAPSDFRTTDRFYAPAGGAAPVRTMWSTPMRGWRLLEGRMLPTSGEAVWIRPEGNLPYGEFEIRAGDVRFNEPPPGSEAGSRGTGGKGKP